VHTHGEREPDGARDPAPPLGAPAVAPGSVNLVLALQRGAGNALVARFLDAERPEQERPERQLPEPRDLELEHPDYPRPPLSPRDDIVPEHRERPEPGDDPEYDPAAERRRLQAQETLRSARAMYELAATHLMLAASNILGQLVPALAAAERNPQAAAGPIAAAQGAILPPLGLAGTQLLGGHGRRVPARFLLQLDPMAEQHSRALDDFALMTGVNAMGVWLGQVGTAQPGGQQAALALAGDISLAHAELRRLIVMAAVFE
jgi:hypothetical protein